MGAALALPFFFDAVNSVVTTAVYDSTHNLPLPWYIGGGVCGLSLVCGVIMNSKIIKEENQDRNQVIESTSCMREVKKLSVSFWVVIAAIFFAEASMGPFNDNLNELLVTRFGVSYTTSGQLILIQWAGLAVFVLIYGRFLRAKPHLRRLSILIAFSFYFAAQMGLYFLPNAEHPQPYHYFVIVVFLISFAAFATVYYSALTPAITFLVEDSVLGTAWGITGSSIGFVQCIVPLLYIWVMNGGRNLVD